MGDGWISVDERLPEYGMEVLVTDGERRDCALYYKPRLLDPMWLVTNICSHDSYEWDIERVTHWQPLPPLPQK